MQIKPSWTVQETDSGAFPAEEVSFIETTEALINAPVELPEMGPTEKVMLDRSGARIDLDQGAEVIPTETLPEWTLVTVEVVRPVEGSEEEWIRIDFIDKGLVWYRRRFSGSIQREFRLKLREQSETNPQGSGRRDADNRQDDTDRDNGWPGAQ